jgi:hypothetical protein
MFPLQLTQRQLVALFLAEQMMHHFRWTPFEQYLPEPIE